MTTEALPTIREELDRKTVDLLGTLVHRAENNRMDRAELSAVSRALWNVTSGLVTGEVSRLCAEVADANKPKALKRHFMGGGLVRTVAWNADAPGYVVMTRNAESLAVASSSKRNTEIGPREAELETIFAGLRKAGYLEL